MAPLLSLLVVAILLGSDPGWAWGEPESSRVTGSDTACSAWALRLDPDNTFNTVTDASVPGNSVMGNCRTLASGTLAWLVPPPTRTDAGHHGMVLYVDRTRFVIDLAGRDGVRLGSVVSVRRDRMAIVHPITGEMLGGLGEEIASGKVSEVSERFSIVEIENLPTGVQIKVKDRVTVKP